MDEKKKIELLKIVLKIGALTMIFWFAFGHLLYPELYHKLVGIDITGLDFRRGILAVAINQIGILTLAIGAAFWFASEDPVKNRAVIKMLLVAGTGAIVVFLYHIFFQGFSSGELVNVALIAVLLLLLGFLYPGSKKS